VGTATKLLPLNYRMQDGRHNNELPRSPRELTTRLRTIIADLRHLGVEVRMHRVGRGRLMEIVALVSQCPSGRFVSLLSLLAGALNGSNHL
jgi:hypothetical protein